MIKKRGRGRPKSTTPDDLKTQKYTVLLDAPIAEWSISTREGLSGMIRRLLKVEHDNQHAASRPVTSEAKAAARSAGTKTGTMKAPKRRAATKKGEKKR